MFLTAQFLRPCSAESASERDGLVVGESVTNRGRAIGIEEIRQRLQNAKAHYNGRDLEAFDKAIDSSVAALRTRYGDQIPAVDAIKFLREFPFPTGDASSALHESDTRAPSQFAPRTDSSQVDEEKVDEKKAPEGMRIERTPVGFLLRASCRSLAGGVVWIGFAVLLGAIPFIAFGDLIRSVWQAEGVSFWLGSTFLAAWAGGAVYALVTGSIGAFGEVRITKTGDSGEIFTGIGKAGWRHRLQWSDFYGVGDRAVASASNRRFGYTTHYIGLNGTSNSYKFGSELDEEKRAFVIAFLRASVFGSAVTPPGPSIPDTARQHTGPSGANSKTGDLAPTDFVPKGVFAGNTISVDRIRQTLETAEADYHGPDPQGFNRAANELIASLKAQYGDQVPAADAVERLEKLARATGGPIAISF